ncbi:Ubiquitin fusion degradation protein UFD1 [Carpediemonas membranifera]|uniref:Ubiquitin fusion degradation protein UFD1 n=1 Tax=Carpediemonas membranifera TaxID=201153 RepID=A0A8J6E1R5_9EUKA|nr:Ubiquitin fusion degradation protein UFD1 [Carpediemonas membranifera]|eukprot:KAG9393386.1 Ubiquitin fusion degradation protein UFD1 [Carpediemonas membranifera]
MLNILTQLNYEFPFIFEVTNIATKAFTHVGVLEFTAPEGTCIIPSWLMANLGLQSNDLVKLRHVNLRKATFAKLQAQDTSFLDITDHRAVLEYHLVKFSCLTKNEIIRIHYNNKSYDLRILELKADGEDINAGCIIDTDLSVDFAAPVGYVEPTPEPAKPDQGLSSKARSNISFGAVRKAANGTNTTTSKADNGPVRGVRVLNAGKRKAQDREWFTGQARTISGGTTAGARAEKAEKRAKEEGKDKSSVWVGKPRRITEGQR